MPEVTPPLPARVALLRSHTGAQSESRRYAAATDPEVLTYTGVATRSWAPRGQTSPDS